MYASRYIYYRITSCYCFQSKKGISFLVVHPLEDVMRSTYWSHGLCREDHIKTRLQYEDLVQLVIWKSATQPDASHLFEMSRIITRLRALPFATQRLKIGNCFFLLPFFSLYPSWPLLLSYERRSSR